MSADTRTDIPPEWRTVRLCEYSESLDLSGRDLIGQLGRSKEDVKNLIGTLATKSEMQTEELPEDYITSVTGEVADEVHEWPNATLGPEFRYLILQFREERLINMSWKFQSGSIPPSAKPWWKFWV